GGLPAHPQPRRPPGGAAWELPPSPASLPEAPVASLLRCRCPPSLDVSPSPDWSAAPAPSSPACWLPALSLPGSLALWPDPCPPPPLWSPLDLSPDESDCRSLADKFEGSSTSCDSRASGLRFFCRSRFSFAPGALPVGRLLSTPAPDWLLSPAPGWRCVSPDCSPSGAPGLSSG